MSECLRRLSSRCLPLRRLRGRHSLIRDGCKTLALRHRGGTTCDLSCSASKVAELAAPSQSRILLSPSRMGCSRALSISARAFFLACLHGSKLQCDLLALVQD